MYWQTGFRSVWARHICLGLAVGVAEGLYFRVCLTYAFGDKLCWLATLLRELSLFLFRIVKIDG